MICAAGRRKGVCSGRSLSEAKATGRREKPPPRRPPRCAAAMVATRTISTTVSVVRVTMAVVYGGRRLDIAPCCLDSGAAVDRDRTFRLRPLFHPLT